MSMVLADEYTANPPPCVNSFEPPEPNVTWEVLRELIEWNHWIDPLTPIPTSSGSGVTGLFQGAKYCSTGLYRPTLNSLMRSLGTVPFGSVNTEQLVRRIYNWVSPIDAVSPEEGVIQRGIINESGHSVRLSAGWAF